MTDPAVTTRLVDLGSFPVLVREAGPEEAEDPPILCLHGGPGMDGSYFFPDPDVWGPGMGALARRYRVVTYDQRGCGGSGVPAEEQPLAISRHVHDVQRVIEALGLERPAIFGHSFGSVLALLFALHHGEALSRLILVGNAPTRAFQEGYRKAVAEDLSPEAKRRLAELESRPLSDEDLHERFSLVLPLYFHRELTDPERRSLLEAVRFSATVNRTLAEALAGYDLTDALPHVRVPALVVYGESDRVVQPLYQLELQGKLPDARFVAFGESGHFPFLEEPEPFSHVVEYFLRHADRSPGRGSDTVTLEMP